MNFLAHLFFADPTAESHVGNLLPDFLHGPIDAALPAEVLRGAALHRRVDAFTDAHSLFRQSVARLKPAWGRYSPILVDIFYDHLLARDWTRHSAIPLRDFADRAYGLLAAGEPWMTESMRGSITRMAANDWLVTYAQPEGIAYALERLERRLSRAPKRPLRESVGDLLAQIDGFAADFDAFFPQLAADVARFKAGS